MVFQERTELPSKMPPSKGQMFRYSEADMEAAIEDVERGLPVATSAKKHKVPRITLLYKVRGKTPRKRKMGRDSYLSSENEELLVQWLPVKLVFQLLKTN